MASLRRPRLTPRLNAPDGCRRACARSSPSLTSRIGVMATYLVLFPISSTASNSTACVDLIGAGVDVGGNLALQRRREHRPGTVTHDLVHLVLTLRP